MAASAGAGPLDRCGQDRAVAALEHAHQRRLRRSEGAFASSSRHSAGVTVSATTIDTSTARP